MTVCDSFLDTHSRPLLIVEGPQGKGERAGFLLNLGKDSSGRLHFELVVDIV